MIRSALVLAGSRGPRDPVADYAGVPQKALVRIADRTMLAHVTQVLRLAGFDRIAVSAGAADVADEVRRLGTQMIAPGPGPSASTAAGFEGLGAPLLVTTADHALLRPEWVSDFVARVPATADVAVLLARRESVEAAAPGSKRTYLRFADGDWSGCNLFYLAHPRASRVIALWQRIERDRKRPWRIVRLLGIRPLFRYLRGTLTLAEAVARLGEIVGVEAAVVECPDGLAAVDVDKPADLDFVRGLGEDASDA